MFWDRNYTPSQTIEALLEKENVTVEEFLDDEDIIQECKSLRKGIVNFFLRPEVIKRLVELVTTEPPPDLPMAQRFRHANMACEILILGIPSLDEKLLADTESLQKLYSYLENEPPLNPLLSSFFSKTFSMLFVKKSEQDWFLYQQMCLQFLEYIKSQKNFLDLICKHFATPIIPDLIMQMIKDVEGGQLKRNLFTWLTEDKLVERLIALLANPLETDKHTYVAEFLCDLIHQGRSMRQTEQENDSFEPAFEGSNPILKNIESEETIEKLLDVILESNAQESAIVAGISVVLTLIKPVVFVEEPNSDRMKYIQDREKEIHEEILTTVIRVIAPRLKEFNQLLQNSPQKPVITTTAGKLDPPFGTTRLQICRLFTVLLQTRNEKVANAICETDFFVTVLGLFKQYCWNNFLHSEVEKCLQLIFYTQFTHNNNNNNSTQGSTIVNDGSFGRGSNNGDIINSSCFDYTIKPPGNGTGDNCSGGTGDGFDPMDTTTMTITNATEGKPDSPAEVLDNDKKSKESDKANENSLIKPGDLNNEEQNMDIDEHAENNDDHTGDVSDQGLNVITNNVAVSEEVSPHLSKDEEEVVTESGSIGNDANKTTSADIIGNPTALQAHVIVDCKLISKLIDCWQHNSVLEVAEKGRRLGYMGHLIKIFKHITNCISESEHIGALIESNLRNDAKELELWQAIVQPNDGEFTKALAKQTQLLANCNAHETNTYSDVKDFQQDTSTWDYIMSSINNLAAFQENITNEDIVFALDHEMYRHDILENENDTDNDNGVPGLNLFQLSGLEDDDDEDGDEHGHDDDGDVEKNMLGGEMHSMFGKSAPSTGSLQVFGVTNSPWDNLDPFGDLTGTNSNAPGLSPWTGDFSADNFADFDAHFNSFANDLGSSLRERNTDESRNHAGSADDDDNADADNDEETKRNSRLLRAADHSVLPLGHIAKEEYDNNANVDKSTALKLASTNQRLSPSSTTNDFTQYKHKDNAETDENMKNEKVAISSSLVRNLHSVMDDSDDIEDDDDDYEDDEGMWTKPLGDHSSSTENVPVQEASSNTSSLPAVITNGPNKIPDGVANKDDSPDQINAASSTSQECNDIDKKIRPVTANATEDVGADDLKILSNTKVNNPSSAAPATKS